jgi:hypothetical protein
MATAVLRTEAGWGGFDWLAKWAFFDSTPMLLAFEKPRGWTPAEYLVWAEQNRQHWNMLERERSWWRCVPELQRFVPKAVEL